MLLLDGQASTRNLGILGRPDPVPLQLKALAGIALLLQL